MAANLYFYPTLLEKLNFGCEVCGVCCFYYFSKKQLFKRFLISTVWGIHIMHEIKVEKSNKKYGSLNHLLLFHNAVHYTTLHYNSITLHRMTPHCRPLHGKW